jgi:hypothetical protein
MSDQVTETRYTEMRKSKNSIQQQNFKSKRTHSISVETSNLSNDTKNVPPNLVKGTVSRDFRPSVFFIKTSVLGIRLRGKSLCEYKFEFAKIFEFFKMHAVSLIPHARSTNDSNGPGSL